MQIVRRFATVSLAALVAAFAPGCTTPSSGGNGCAGITCSGHGTCVVTGGAAACQCDGGYVPSGLACVASAGCDPNPCTEANKTRCEIDNHQVVCACDLGWHDSGGACVPDDNNACFPNPCTESHKTQCALENGAPVCKCDAGYAADGNGACTILNPCSPNPCTAPHKTQCSNESGAAKCGCDANYTEDAGGNCVAGDPCTPNPCTATPHKNVCTVVAGQAYCSCENGYKSDGAGGCVLSPCDPDPCTDAHKTTCSNLGGGNFKCGCDSNYIDDGTGTCIVSPDPSCTTSHPSGDPYETDDCYQLAKELPVGSTQYRTIDIAGDVDWMKSPLLAGHSYHFECTTSSDLVVYLYDTDATTQLKYADDPEALDYQPTVDGTYYWKVRHYYSTDTGTYSVNLAEISDDFGNSASTASAITLGTAVNGNIDYGGDYDWFKFDGVTGHMYSADTTGTDTYLYLYDSDGTTIISQADAPPIFLTATADATYYVAVRHYYSTSTGAYVLTVTDLGAEVSGDTPGTAGVIVPGTSYGAMISPAGDNDWYKFDTLAGHAYKVDTTGTDTYVYIYDTDGTTILSENDYPPLYLAAAGAGPYFVRVRHYSSTATGQYTLSVTDLGLDDGNDAAHATVLPVGATGLTGYIVPAGDVDWFKWDATANHAYQISVTGISTYIDLYDTDGTTLLKDSTTGSAYLYATTNATYYARVKDYTSTAVGQYTITAVDVGVDDHGNDAAHATPAFTSGVGVDGVINYPGDDDWFSFQAEANHIYSINTAFRAPSTSFDSYVYVYDTNGTTVLKESDPVPMVWSASVPGTYYVRVRHYYATYTGYYYTLTITDVGADDCGSGPSTTCVIVPGTPPGTPVTGHIEVGGDDDWWAFDATAGHVYKCTTPGTMDTYVYLIDTDGATALKAQDDPLIYLVAPTSGRYYYKVRAYSSVTTGDYQVLCTDEGVDDYPNGPVGAPVVPTDGTVENGAIQYPGDVDWFAFVAQAGATYKIDAQPVASADTYVELYSPDGATLITSADTPPTITRQLTSAGTYFVRVKLATTTTAGAYTLAITKQ